MNDPVQKLLDGLPWEPLPNNGQLGSVEGLPYATHEAVLDLYGLRIRCYQLSDGRRVLAAEDVQALFGFESDEP